MRKVDMYILMIMHVIASFIFRHHHKQRLSENKQSIYAAYIESNSPSHQREVSSVYDFIDSMLIPLNNNNKKGGLESERENVRDFLFNIYGIRKLIALFLVLH